MKRRILYFLCSSLLAIFLLLIIFAIKELWPFGDNTYLFWDMMYENVNIFTWLSNVVKGNANGVYSLIGGFGYETVGLYAYYLMSPLNLLLLLCDNRTIPYAISIIVLIKTGLAAGNMQVYLYSKNSSFYSVIFSLFYGLSSYVICYEYNIMWMDVIVLLPLVIMGLDALIEVSNGLFYALFLGLSVITNYYMGYMTCLFCVIYFVLNIIILSNIEIRKKIITSLKFALYSLLGGGISAFITLPAYVYMGWSANKNSDSPFYILKNLTNIFFKPNRLLQCMLVGTFDETQGILGHRPLLYAGIFSVFLVILLLISKITINKRIYIIIFILIMMISLITDSLYRIWHGCYAPAGCWWRYAFLWTFLIVSFAYEGIEYLSDSNIKRILISFAVIIAILFVVYFEAGFSKAIIINLLLCIAYCLAILLGEKSNNYYLKKICIIFVIIIASAELLYNTNKIYNYQFEKLNIKYTDYSDEIETVEELKHKVGISNDTREQIYRTDYIENYNKGLLYNLNSVNMYTSVENDITWNLLYRLGLGKPEYSSELKYNAKATSLTNALIGMRYVISHEVPYGYVEKAEKSSLIISENDNIFPMAFLVDDDIYDINIDNSAKLIDIQNGLFRSLIYAPNEDVYALYKGEQAKNKEDVYPEGKISNSYENVYSDGINYYLEDTREIIDVVNKGKKHIKEISFDNSRINLSVDNCDGLATNLVVSVPYEDGWEICIDGIKTDTSDSGIGFLTIPIDQGIHKIEMKYQVAGLKAGMFLSILSAAFLTGIYIWTREKRVAD